MREKLFNNKILGIFFITIVYVVAFISSYFLSFWIENLLLKLFFIDILATIIIWLISLFIKNSSLYDPYWSVTPMIFVIYMLILNWKGLNLYSYIFIVIFLIWSIRLTINWAITFTNLKTEDWRYVHFRSLGGIKWHLANFFGIMMIPTLFVFLGYIPIHYFLSTKANALSLLGSLVVLFGIALEFFADRQIHHFVKNTKEKVTCKQGLWKYSRHPNYLGEICIWVGAYVALVATSPALWYLCTGALAMIFLFNVISIPLMEKRQIKRRSDYLDYKNSTSRLLLLPNKR